MIGTIKTIIGDKGFGFIQQAAGERDLFFHARDLAGGLAFDETLIERRVEFDVIATPKGQRASGVRPAE